MDKLLNSKLFILLYRNWKWALVLILISSSGTILQHYLRPSYRSVSKIYIRSSEESPLLRSIGQMSGYINFHETMNGAQKYVKLLVAHNFEKYIRSGIELELKDDPNRLVEYFKQFGINSTKIKSAKGLAAYLVGKSNFSDKQDIINIVVHADTPLKSASISAFMMDKVYEYLIFHEGKEIEDAQKYLNGRLVDTQSRINNLNKEIEDFKGGQDVINISDGGSRSLASESYAKLTEESWLVQVRIREIDQLVKKFKKQMAFEEKSELVADKLAWRGHLIDKIQNLMEEKESNQTRYLAIRSQLTKISRMIKPQFEQKIYDLKRKLDQEHTIYRDIKKQMFETQVQKISVENQIRPYEAADVSSARRVFPLTYKLFMIIIFSCSVIVVIAVAWEKLFPVISEKRQVVGMGLSYLGGVPNLLKWATSKRKKWNKEIPLNRNKYIHNPKMRNKISVIFQLLSSRIVQNLQHSEKTSGQGKVLSLLSNKVDEGKSMITSNLAVALGSFGLKVLVVDTDNFKSRKSNYLCNPNSKGFVELLSGVPVNPLSYVQKSVFDNVDYLPSGRGKFPLDVDRENAYKNLLIGFRRFYDYIIVDTPAFETGPECLHYNDRSDMTIVVSKAYSSSVSDLEELQEALQFRGSNKIFSIINGQESNTNYPESYVGAYGELTVENQDAAS